MSRVFEFGSSEVKGVNTIDIHDKSIPLKDRVEFMLAFIGKCNCDDFLCADEELALAINEIEGLPIH